MYVNFSGLIAAWLISRQTNTDCVWLNGSTLKFSINALSNRTE